MNRAIENYILSPFQPSQQSIKWLILTYKVCEDVDLWINLNLES